MPVVRPLASDPVSGVYDRIDAMPAMADLWPREPADGSEFAADGTRASISTYTVVRILLLEAIQRLRAAAAAAQDRGLAEQGVHILLLRPALVSTAKAAWVARGGESAERVSRAARLIAEDRRNGAKALRKAVANGAPPPFNAVADAYERSSEVISAAVRFSSMQPKDRLPGDEVMILELGSEIDRYYGTRSATSDVQLLWRASSSLAHGERWYVTLTTGKRRAQVAEVITVRSLDVVCSGLNVTALGVLSLATARM